MADLTLLFSSDKTNAALSFVDILFACVAIAKLQLHIARHQGRPGHIWRKKIKISERHFALLQKKKLADIIEL